MAVPDRFRAVWARVRIESQNNSRDISPVGIFGSGVEQPEINDEMLLVIARQHGIAWRGLGYRRIKRRRLQSASFPGINGVSCCYQQLKRGRVVKCAALVAYYNT